MDTHTLFEYQLGRPLEAKLVKEQLPGTDSSNTDARTAARDRRRDQPREQRAIERATRRAIDESGARPIRKIRYVVTGTL